MELKPILAIVFKSYSFNQKDRSQTGFPAFLYQSGGQISRIKPENDFQSMHLVENSQIGIMYSCVLAS